jgi:FkbM family methyltransferase
MTGIAELLRRSAPFLWFCENEVAALPGLVRPGSVCLDVGAAYGLYTWLLADLAGPAGQVHAFEPQPGLAAFLRITRRVLRAGNVTVHQLGLDNAPGLGWLARPSRGALPVPGRAFLGRDATGFGSNREFRRHRAIVTHLTTLDAFVDQHGLSRLDFVKADIEGAEGRLLAGAAHTLRAMRPILLLELENRHLTRFGTDAGAIVGMLAEFGYVPRYFTGRNWSARSRTTHRNVLFVPDDR